MSEDRPLKSAYELAMERLRREDRERGIDEAKPLSDEQKREIARLRDEARAKLAELQIMQRDKLAAAGDDPVKIQELEEHTRIDRGRIKSSLETAIARVREGRPARPD